MLIVIQLIRLVATLLTWLLIIHVVLSFFMSPYHPLRQAIGRVIEPMLAPIRRFMPRTGMFDFSPLVLLILIQLVEFVLVRLIVSLAG
jgi:YggT family protein